jgi:hypothetical protein
MRHRTALITAGSIAVVIFAAAVAVGANLGILNAADSRPVGSLSASAAVKVVRAHPTEVPQKYVIRKAGTVSVAATKSGLRVVNVTARRGWRWTLQQKANRRLTVTFKSGSRVYKFMTVLRRHGRIVARVDQPVTRIVPYASVAIVATTSAAQYVAPASGSVATTSSARPASAPAPASTHSGDNQSEGGGADD